LYLEKAAQKATYQVVFKDAKKFAIGAAAFVVALTVASKYFASQKVIEYFEGDAAPNPTGFPKRRDIWNRLTVGPYTREYTLRASPSYTVQDFMKVLQQRVFKIHSPRTKITMRGFAVGNGIVIFPRHLLFPDAPSGAGGVVEGTIAIFVGSAYVNVKLDPKLSFAIANRDIIVAYVPEFPIFKEKWDLLSEMSPTCLARTGDRADEAWLVRSDSITPYTSRLCGMRGYVQDVARLEYSWTGVNPTQDGDCGSPVVAKFGDKFYLVGFHCAGRSDQHGKLLPGIAESIARNEIQVCVDLIKAHQPSTLAMVTDPEMIDPGADSLTFQGLPRSRR